jgi:O-antigen ligase
LDVVELIALCACAFAIVAFNGRPARYCSGYVILPAALILLALEMMKNGTRLKLPRRALPEMLLFLAWAFIATLSTIANPSVETATNLLFGYITPTLLLAAIIGLRPSLKDTRLIIYSLAAGTLIRFTYGGFVFLQSWGLPSLPVLMTAHFDLERMGPYIDATFGNTSSTASLLTPVIATLCLSMFTLRPSRAGRLLIAAAIMIAAANILITGARGAILTIGLAVLVAVFKLNWRARIVVGILLGVVAIAFVANAGIGTLDRLQMAATLNVQEDTSLQERIDSIEFGLGTMRTHPFGVGPGMSYLYNPWAVPHQFAIAQGSDLGAAGALPSILLTILVGFRVLTYRARARLAAQLSFLIGCLAWFVYAMTTDLSLNSLASMPWVGILVLFLGLSEVAPETAQARAQPVLRAAPPSEPASWLVHGRP